MGWSACMPSLKIDRATMHFTARMGTGGADTFDRSCENFLDQLDHLLVRPWGQLNKEEQPFVTGYYCHLAAE